MRACSLFAAALMFMSVDAASAQAQTSKFGIPSSSGSGAIALPVSKVSELPTCDVSHIGYVRYVTDASSPTFNATVTGGSTTKTGVVCNGTNWVAQ